MKTFGKHLPLIRKPLGTKLLGCGVMLGSQLQSHHHHKRHFMQDDDGQLRTERIIFIKMAIIFKCMGVKRENHGNVRKIMKINLLQ